MSGRASPRHRPQAPPPARRPVRNREATGTALRFQARQTDGTWATLTSATLSTGGSATAKITFSRTGTWTLRVYRPGTTTLTGTYSSAWSVKVS
ncbi:hypothetical protein [Streptomyces sp. YIM S03343]